MDTSALVLTSFLDGNVSFPLLDPTNVCGFSFGRSDGLLVVVRVVRVATGFFFFDRADWDIGGYSSFYGKWNRVAGLDGNFAYHRIDFGSFSTNHFRR